MPGGRTDMSYGNESPIRKKKSVLYVGMGFTTSEVIDLSGV